MSSPYPAYGNPQLHVGATPYMYPPTNYLSQYSLTDSTTTVPGKHEFAPYSVSRTPSPTPSEAAQLSRKSVVDWKTLANWRFWLRRDWLCVSILSFISLIVNHLLGYYVILIILAVITALITIFHHQIVDKLTPVAHRAKTLPGGWSIPIFILFIISFPPLFGHEIVAILCGVVWGLWIGFAIVAAGTFLGELGNFYAFKYCCRARGEKLERTSIQYACLARIVREGGFRIALIARFSAIPGHFTTAVFSSCGMDVWTFALAAFLTLPKQFATVYIGVIIEGAGQNETTSQRVASYMLIAATTIVTFIAAWYIYRELNRVKPAVIYDRRKARQTKLDLTRSYYNNNVSSASALNPNPSESDIPLRPYDSERDPGFEETIHHQSAGMGPGVGYAPDPRLHAPRPRPPSFSPSALYAPPGAAAAVTSFRDSEDEWANAHTPQTARPPDVAPAPTVPIPPSHSQLVEDHRINLSFPSPRQSPHAGHAQSPSPNTTAQYLAYQPERFAVSPAQGSTEMTLEAVQVQGNQYASGVTGVGSSSRTFSPPPSYR
ncbi:snare associated Golgi protein-domain-containing protein [Russula dissimulans]|nr:snare associated Golgi protein-domain-containing protein [Russula dissimulans]